MIRSKYWSTSAFAHTITRMFGGLVKPSAETTQGWATWKKDAKAQSPFMYWFTETFLDAAQDFVNYPLDKLLDVRSYLYNRFICKTHFCKTQLTPGQYYDTGTRIFHGMFTELVDYIEIEKAWMLVRWDNEAAKRFDVPWWKLNVPVLFRWKRWRCPSAGLEYLKWESGLVQDFEWLPEQERLLQEDFNKPTVQAIAAQEQYELYDWWVNIRPSRIDANIASGWSSLYWDSCSSVRTPEQSTPEFQQHCRESIEKRNNIETQYETEDVEMMIRLVKIYDTLWT